MIALEPEKSSEIVPAIASELSFEPVSTSLPVSLSVLPLASAPESSKEPQIKNSSLCSSLPNNLYLYQNPITGIVSSSKLSIYQLCRLLSPPCVDKYKNNTSTSSKSIVNADTNLLEYDPKLHQYSKDGWKAAKSTPILRVACTSWYYATTAARVTNNLINENDKTNTSNSSSQCSNGPVSCRELAHLFSSGIIKKTDMVYSTFSSININNTWTSIKDSRELQLAIEIFSPSVSTPISNTSDANASQSIASTLKKNCAFASQQRKLTNDYNFSMMTFDKCVDNNTNKVIHSEMCKSSSLQEDSQHQHQQSEQVQDELEAFLSSTSHSEKKIQCLTGPKNGRVLLDEEDDNEESYESDGGTKYVKDARTGNWIHHALALHQRSLYEKHYENNNVKHNTGKRPTALDTTTIGMNNEILNNKSMKKRKNKAKFSNKKSKNWIYATNLPTDTDIDEVTKFFSKVGIIDLNPETQKPKIKLYKSKDDTLKGDASVCYAKYESVELAISILDESYFRLNNHASVINFKVRVERAKFEQHGIFHEDKRKKISNIQRKVVKLAIQQQIDWDNGEYNGRLTGGRKGLCIIVLKYVFNLQITDKVSTEKEENNYFQQLENKIRLECKKCYYQMHSDGNASAVSNTSKGEDMVEKITFFSRHPDGITIVKLKQPGVASEAIKQLNGQIWDIKIGEDIGGGGGKAIEASFWDGITDFTIDSKDPNEKQMEEKRHEEFGNWIENLTKDELPEEFKLRTE